MNNYKETRTPGSATNNLCDFKPKLIIPILIYMLLLKYKSEAHTYTSKLPQNPH